MKFDRTGFILYTIKYNECVAFYKNILELDILFKAENITCFSFGNSYLMIELDDEFTPNLSYKNERVRTCLRMNVPNVKLVADMLTSKNISVDYQEHSWGTIAKFLDPDGNLCAFKDTSKFELQIQNHLI